MLDFEDSDQVVNQQFNSFLPGEGPVSKYRKSPADKHFRLRIADSARSRAAFMMYLATLAHLVESNFSDYEFFIELLHAESGEDHPGSVGWSSGSRKLMLRNVKRAMGKSLIRQKRDLEEQFQKLVDELSKLIPADAPQRVAEPKTRYGTRRKRKTDDA